MTIGPDTIIHPFTFIGRDASIGADCAIGPFACVPRESIVPEGTTVAGNVSPRDGDPEQASGAERMAKLDADKLKVFTGRANPQLAQKICDYLEIPLGRGRTELFPDGELIVKVDEDVRGRDCFIIQPTSHPVNAHLMELMIWIDCLQRASAKRVTAVIPYFGYARQDRKDEGRTPITAKLVANLIERAGADRVVSVDLHAAQVQGFFDIPVDHLHAGAGADQVVQEPEAREPRVRLAGRRQREAGPGLRQPCSAARSASSTSGARAARDDRGRRTSSATSRARTS